MKWDPRLVKIGCCVGNGRSRLQIDLSEVNKIMPLTGCNALYRDYRPDKLVCVDQKMLEEILEAHYEGLVAFDPIKNGWASGPQSVALMLNDFPGIQQLFMVGHDLGTIDGLANVYAYTSNYEIDNHIFENFVNQLDFLFKMYPQVKFTRVILPGLENQRLKSNQNYDEITVDQFFLECTKRFAKG